MPIGSILSKFNRIKLSTADNKEYDIIMNPVYKLAIKIIGIPHLGFRKRASIILKLFKKVKKDVKILDAGCGYGIYSLILAEKGYNLTSLDIEAIRIKEIESMKNEYGFIKDKIKTKIGSLTNLPFKNEEFEVIICSEVLEHIKDYKKAFLELGRVLKKNGALIVSVPTDSEQNLINFKKFGHERPGYSINMISGMASKLRLKIERVFFYDYYFGKLAFKIHNSIKNNFLAGILFYPFYLFSFLDKILKLGRADGMVILFKKSDFR